ncbi:hypothetical protein T492DRAFT_1079307 [Pavlovales sp. CCMP2436]|nr:hypothetical protein T492DRAFT_1079307 [Pavlovales sp. CCMP2436]
MLLVHTLTSLPPGYSVDVTKSSGFRVNVSWTEAAIYALAPGHNEFWNCLTDVLPCIFFAAAGFAMAPSATFKATPPELQSAILWTIAGTCLQHMCSLASHMFTSVSARMSHAIWFLDYSGIGLNFVWNAPAMALVWRYETFAPYWDAWFAWNMVLTAVALGGSLWLAAVHKPCPKLPTAGESWTKTFFGKGLPSVLFLALLLFPNLFFTAACGIHADGRALGVVLVLPFALTYKEAHLPERLVETFGAGRFDCSFLHSHVIWHLLVWLMQTFYLLAYVRIVDRSGQEADCPFTYAELPLE